MKAVGIDLAISKTGVACFEGGSDIPLPIVVGYGAIEYKKPITLEFSAMLARYMSIAERVILFVKEHNPDIVVFEHYAFCPRGRTNNLTKLAELRGIIFSDLVNITTNVAFVPPTRLKMYATGNGTSDKEAMIAQALKEFPAEVKGESDMADALYLAHYGICRLFPAYVRDNYVRMCVVDDVPCATKKARERTQKLREDAACRT